MPEGNNSPHRASHLVMFPLPAVANDRRLLFSSPSSLVAHYLKSVTKKVVVKWYILSNQRQTRIPLCSERKNEQKQQNV